MLKSANANLLDGLITRIQQGVEEIRFIAQDVGQLENYDIRPAVSFPCLLIDLEDFNFSDNANYNLQQAEGIVSFRLGLVKYTDVNSLSTPQWRENALRYYELEHRLFNCLHGWSPVGFGRLLRRATATERREDDIRVRIAKYVISYTEVLESDKVKVSRPGVDIGK